MKITIDQVRKIARLARLELDEERLEAFAEKFDGILGYMDKLAEIDTSNVEPMYTPVDNTSVMREDTVRKEYQRDEILGNSPESDGSYFIVPKII